MHNHCMIFVLLWCISRCLQQQQQQQQQQQRQQRQQQQQQRNNSNKQATIHLVREGFLQSDLGLRHS